MGLTGRTTHPILAMTGSGRVLGVFTDVEQAKLIAPTRLSFPATVEWLPIPKSSNVPEYTVAYGVATGVTEYPFDIQLDERVEIYLEDLSQIGK